MAHTALYGMFGMHKPSCSRWIDAVNECTNGCGATRYILDEEFIRTNARALECVAWLCEWWICAFVIMWICAAPFGKRFKNLHNFCQLTKPQRIFLVSQRRALRISHQIRSRILFVFFCLFAVMNFSIKFIFPKLNRLWWCVHSERSLVTFLNYQTRNWLSDRIE